MGKAHLNFLPLKKPTSHMLQLKIPPPLYMLFFAALMKLLAINFPSFSLAITRSQQVGIAFFIIALAIDLLSILAFLQHKTTINPLHPNKASSLVTSGPYRYTRNPMYLGLLCLLIGWGFYLANFATFIVLPFFMCILTTQQIIAEEKILKAAFGSAYQNYKNTTRRWF